MKKKKRIFSTLLALLIFITASPQVYAKQQNSSDEDQILAPYFFVEGADPAFDSFPLKETKVTTNINGTIAETYVVQTYSNDGPDPINASYVFPASTKVAVHGMKMEVGNQIVTAQIKEKEEAKEEFEEAKSEGKSASLLEQQRPNVFTMDVANIMPGDTVRIELHYTELISPTDGTYQFVFPTVVGPRYADPNTNNEDTINQTTADGLTETGNSSNDDDWMAIPYIKQGGTVNSKYDITVNLSTGVPVTGLSCRTHETNITWTDNSTAKISLANPEDFAGDRDFILDYKLTGEDINCGLMLNTGETENFFMLMVQPPERYEPEDLPPREYIFVLDVSGSMYGYPLDTAKSLITNLVTNLRETDTFNLILFSGESSQMSAKSLPATDENIKKAIRLIDRQEGSGGTELAPALENAISIPGEENVSRNIVVITDGYIYGESEIFDMIENNFSSANFFSFGIGCSVNRYLIEGIAKTGQGEAFVVTESDEAKDTAERFRTYIESPVLTDVQVDFEGFDVYDVEPSNIPTLFAQRPITLFGKWKGEPTGTIHISGKAGTNDYSLDIPVSETANQESGNAIQYLWARSRVERLTDYGLGNDDPKVKDEVTQIGLNYSMITPYTSFIAVLDTVRNESGDATDVDQPLPMPLEVSNLAIGYTKGSEPGDFILILAILSIAAIGFLRYKNKKERNVAC